MVRRCCSFQLFHHQHVFRQSLDRFDQKVRKSELVVLRVDSDVINERCKLLIIFGQIVNHRVCLREVIEVLEIEFEEIHFFLHFIENYFIVTVVLSLIENGCEEQLV